MAPTSSRCGSTALTAARATMAAATRRSTWTAPLTTTCPTSATACIRFAPTACFGALAAKPAGSATKPAGQAKPTGAPRTATMRARTTACTARKAAGSGCPARATPRPQIGAGSTTTAKRPSRPSASSRCISKPWDATPRSFSIFRPTRPACCPMLR